jgi:hypothetical protein
MIGTNAAGTAAVPNGFGVDVEATGASIGGTASGAGNVISGNANDGIVLSQPSTLVEGNLIGTDPTGVQPVSNQGDGLYLDHGSVAQEIIGVPGAGNTIAYNGGAGVGTSRGTTGGTIRFDSIFENGDPGINLNNAGVSSNVPNGEHNAPVLSTVNNGLATGTLNASPNGTYVIDFYANPTSDASPARPQGRTYLGSTTTYANAAGNASFNFSYTSVAGEPLLTATATDAAGTTSDFSSPVEFGITTTVLTLSATVGVAFQGQVASFTSTDVVATAANFTATINWGDGSSNTAGTVLAYGSEFVVVGAHTFNTANSATPVTVTITDNVANSQGTASSLADVTGPGGLLTAFGASPAFVAGTSSSALVATFTDTNTASIPGQFTATIAWGDGTASSAGVVSVAGAGFSVSGSHAYAAAGTDPIVVTIRDAVSGVSITAASTAAVAAPSATLTATGATFAAATGVAFHGTVASFTSKDTAAGPANFTATIAWGDGTASSAGTVVAAPGGFVVVGTHTYTTANPAAPVTVTLTDTLANTQATTNSLANVAGPSGVVTAYGQTATFVAGTAAGLPLASFTDSNPNTIAGQFTANVTWGDGTTSAGTVSASGAGFVVTGTHTYNYASANESGVSVVITDHLTGLTATAIPTITVAPVALTIQPSNFAVTPGKAFSGAVGTFSDANPLNSPSFYTATINWGDGTANTKGTINGPNPFTVNGTHTYQAAALANQGTAIVTITITDPNGQTATAVARAVDPPNSSSNPTVAPPPVPSPAPAAGPTSPTATPAPAPATDSLTMSPETITLSPNGSFNGVLAWFTDSGPSEPASAYKATIDWGKGRRSAGMITGSNGRFNVSGHHRFPRFSGTKPVTITVTNPEGQTLSVTDSMSEASHVREVFKLKGHSKGHTASHR